MAHRQRRRPSPHRVDSGTETTATGRRILHLAITLLVAALSTLVVIPAAGADDTGSLLGLVNGLRASRGIGPLTTDPGLSAVAQRWSAHMAATGVLAHNGSLAAGVPAGWTKLGENVGAGGGVTIVFNALVASPFHLANMLDTSYTLTGIGVAVGARGTLWLTEDFEAHGLGAVTPVPPGTVPPVTLAPVTAPPTTPRPVAPHLATAPTAPSVAPTVPTTMAPMPASTIPAPAPDPTLPPAAVPADPGGPGLTAPGLPQSRPMNSLTIKRTAALAAHPAGADGGRPWALVVDLAAVLSLVAATAMIGRQLLRPASR